MKDNESTRRRSSVGQISNLSAQAKPLRGSLRRQIANLSYRLRTPRVPSSLSKGTGYLLLCSLFLSIIGIPLAIAAIAPKLAPYAAKHPGKNTLDNPGGEIPKLVQAFAPFKDTLGISWDNDFLYLETNGLPDHGMMTGITAWQQQIPIAHDYTGQNAFKLPLKPELLDKPDDLTLMGPIAMAVNGIPIFHALTQSGKDAYAGGELDKWGGHCGRADDYHYHIAPKHLEAIVGKGNPVAFGLDGYPIYTANPAIDKPLDECHGYFDDNGNYRYVGELKPPYVMSYFRGKADLDSRPRAGGIRPHLQPLRGATITGFSGSLEEGFHLEYNLRGSDATIDYQIDEKGGIKVAFNDPDGTKREEAYEKRAGGGRDGQKGKGKGRGDKGKGKGDKGKGGKGKGRPKGGGDEQRRPWLLNHADELDQNGDGIVEYEAELLSEVRKVFAGYDHNQDNMISSAEIGQRGAKSPLSGFVRQHADELDRNGDGISYEEVKNQFTKFFKKFDRNSDNKLTQGEIGE